MKNILMFDVEATSLHGTGFAVGAVVFSPQKKYKKTLKECGEYCPHQNIYNFNMELKFNSPENVYYEWVQTDMFELLSKEGSAKVGDWVKENVLPNLSDMPTCETDKELRTAFFDFYVKHKENSEIWSDVNFPVETNFLSAIVNDNIAEREWSMPYPLKDASTIVDVSIDRCSECGIDGLRKHHPLDDCTAIVCLLLKALGR